MTLHHLRTGVAVLALAAGSAMPLAAQELTIGLRAGPESIDPHWSTLGSHAEALRHIFDTLVGVDENLQLEPALATSWEAIDPTTWEFRIREGVRFHDGSELTAHDVKFSIERIPEVTGPMSMTIYTQAVTGVEVVDDHTLRVSTRGTVPSLPNDFIRLFVVPASIGMEARNEQFNDGSTAIGTGPFRFVSWTPQGDLVLERFDDHWGGAPHWERVIRREIPDDAARVAALRSGQVDLINFVPASDYTTMAADPRLDTFVEDSVYILNVAPVVRDTLPQKVRVNGREIDENPLQDLRVRTALDLAIDRETIVRVVLEGLGTPATQLMPEGFFGYSAELGPREYNLDRARELLAEAGYPDGFEIEFRCTANRVPGDSVVCEALAQMWSRLGLTVNAQALPGAVFFPAAAREEFSLALSAWGTLTGEASYTYGSLLHTRDAELGLGAFNRTGYSNPEFDALFQQARETLDDDERRVLFEQGSYITMQDRGLIPTVILQTVWAAPANTLTFTPRVDQETLAHRISPVTD
ncbi:MAG: ABC transporter substrate-binding protein [Alkalilacustris sp.]